MKYLETILAFLTQLARIIFPRKQNRQPVTAPVLILCLLLLSLLSLLMRETEVTLTCIGAILSLSPKETGEAPPPKPTGPESPDIA